MYPLFLLMSEVNRKYPPYRIVGTVIRMIPDISLASRVIDSPYKLVVLLGADPNTITVLLTNVSQHKPASRWNKSKRNKTGNKISFEARGGLDFHYSIFSSRTEQCVAHARAPEMWLSSICRGFEFRSRTHWWREQLSQPVASNSSQL